MTLIHESKTLKVYELIKNVQSMKRDFKFNFHHEANL